MIRNLSETPTFTLPLGTSAHRLAQQFCQQHADPGRARQVYLNTLAVTAVNYYLQCMGIKTDWGSSHSYDRMMQAAIDVADLNLEGLGKLECRPLLLGAETVAIPPDVWCDRIAYVAVQLDPSLREATLLGFTAVTAEQVPISQLHSLDQLMEQLHQIRLKQAGKSRVKLSQWLEDTLEEGWRSLESLLGGEQLQFAFSLRSTAPSLTTVRRAKLIDLGLQLGNQTVVLLMAITPMASASETEPKAEILAQVHPVDGQPYLPSNLKIRLLSTCGAILQEVKSRQHDNYIQLKRFRGVAGECFDIHVAIGEVSVTETFEI